MQDRPTAHLNPFAFPSDTDSRFALLVVSVVGVGLLFYSLIYEAIPVTGELRRVQYEKCRELADPDASTGSFADRLARIATNSECTSTVDRLQAAAMLGGVTFLVAVAAGIYWSAPRRKIGRQRLEVLAEGDAADVLRCLAELCHETGLSPVPRFVWDPLDSRVNGSAFGRLGRYYVALTGGLVTQFHVERPVFRAVILHELAHLRNADVDKTYFAIAVWQSFLATALLPLAVSLILSGRTPADVVGVTWRVVPFALLVYLMRNAVLRAREVYADARASVWDGPSGALRRTLQMLGSPSRAAWRRVLSVHPDPAVRRQMLDDNSALFRPHPWDAFAAGIAAGIVFLNIDTLLALSVRWPWDFLRGLAAALLIAPLLIGVLGLSIWRATLVALARGEEVQKVGRLAVVAGLGFFLGQILSFGAAFVPTYTTDERAVLTGVPLVVMTLGWGVLLLGVLILFLRWIVAGASTWLELAARGRSPRTAYWLGITIASGLLAVWLGMLFVVYVVFRWTGGLLASPEFASEYGAFADTLGTTVVASPLAGATFGDALILAGVALPLIPTATLVIVWAFPLVPWFWRERVASGSVSTWMSLDPSSSPLILPRQPPLRPDFALAIGVLGGLGFCFLAFLGSKAIFSPSGARLVELLAGPRPGPGELRERWASAFVQLWTWSEVVLAVVLLLGVAAIVLNRVRRLSQLHVLLATWVAGSLIVELGTPLLFGGALPSGMATADWFLRVTWLSLVASGVAVAAALAAFGGSAVLGWVAGAWRRLWRSGRAPAPRIGGPRPSSP